MSDRAIQFSPFAALKGYYDLIRQKERVIVDKIELMEDGAEILSQKLKNVRNGMMIKVIHYSAGEYISTEGIVTRIDAERKRLTVVKEEIEFENIYDIIGMDFVL